MDHEVTQSGERSMPASCLTAYEKPKEQSHSHCIVTFLCKRGTSCSSGEIFNE